MRFKLVKKGMDHTVMLLWYGTSDFLNPVAVGVLDIPYSGKFSKGLIFENFESS